MNPYRRNFNSRLVCILGMLAIPMGVNAQTPWPAKPITVVVGYAAGGGADYVMRQLAPGLTKRLGQTIIIDNKPGASGSIAARHVASAAGDGYTLMGVDAGAMVLNSALYSTLSYDAVKDFTPVTLVIRVPLIIVAHPSTPFSSLPSLIELSKRSPLSYASAGKGTSHQLGMELLKKESGLQAQDVSYKGAGPAAVDVIAGHVPIAPLDAIVALPHLRAGKLKALAVLTSKRIPSLPDVPTAAELGYTGAEAYAWVGIVAPKSTPQEIVTRLSSEIREVAQTPTVAKAFADLGMEAVLDTPTEFASYITAEQKRWHPLIKSLGLKLD